MPALLSGEFASIGSCAGRILLGAIFLQSGLQKLRHSLEWRGVAANYRILPEPVVPLFSSVLPWAELVFAAALWFGPVRIGAVCAGASLLVFCAAVGINLARGRSHIDCGCFQSSLRQTLNVRVLVRNGALLAIAAGVGTSANAAAMPLSAAVVATSFGGVCFVLYLTLNELVVHKMPLPALPSLKANWT